MSTRRRTRRDLPCGTMTAQLHENERNIVRCEKARKKPYFGRIDFKDPRQKSQESCAS